MRKLSKGYEPGEYDVICGRGKRALDHVGNIRFRDLIRTHLPEYSIAVTKTDKSMIVSAIIDTIRRLSPEGGFIKQFHHQDPSGGSSSSTSGGKDDWYEVGDHFAREKCGQTYVIV